MIEIRAAVTDEDLEAWRCVRAAVVPNELVTPVEALRRDLADGRLYVLAVLGDEVVGSGAAGRSNLGGGSLMPRVLEPWRRRGIGSLLLGVLADHAVASGYTEAGGVVDDPGSLEFALRFGFREFGRQIEQARALDGSEQPPEAPDGIELVSLADRPELQEASFEALAVSAAEMPTPRPMEMARTFWDEELVPVGAGTFLALEAGDIVGCAGFLVDPDDPSRAENTLTAVRRDQRGRGIARALKEHALAWAAASGVTEVYTWTQDVNVPMLHLNRRLGYLDRLSCVGVRGPLPLPVAAETAV